MQEVEQRRSSCRGMRMSGHRPTRRPGAQTQAESHLNPLGRSSGVPSAGYWIFDPQALQATLESLSPRWFGRHSGWQRLAQSTHASQQYLPDSGNMWFIRPIHRASFGLYNTVAEVDMLVDALEKAKAMF